MFFTSFFPFVSLTGRKLPKISTKNPVLNPEQGPTANESLQVKIGIHFRDIWDPQRPPKASKIDPGVLKITVFDVPGSEYDSDDDF